jgi:hypothetical protein
MADVPQVIESFCNWLSGTSVSVAFQTAEWFVPLVQTIHILAIGVLLTACYVIALRISGITRGSRPLASMVIQSGPWIWSALGILLVSGALLTITEPARELLNWAFRIKMIMVAALAVMAYGIQLPLTRNPAYWDQAASRRLSARLIGAMILLLGAAIVTAGRWIAYV